MKHVGILGTAGHIDHGKTALVKALTGIDCDRLPEERERGITIDLGFAELELGDVSLAIVDVPGHERFIRNMLAGATGFDLACLIVAADDGIMPQTREHLEILKHLRITQGVTVITKCDLVSLARVAELTAEIREFTRGSFLAEAAILPTSARQGQGIHELRTELHRLATQTRLQECDKDMPFRMSIDRVFSRAGFGTIVTGTVATGRIRTGETATLYRLDGSSEAVSIRGLHQHGQSVVEVARGQRAALNLANVDRHTLQRGDLLVQGRVLTPGSTITARLTASAEVSRGIRHRLPCRLHLGTAELPVTVSLLEHLKLLPGQTGLAQFHSKPFVCCHGQPFVLRDDSGQTTLGGGIVLLPASPKVRRRQLDLLLRLDQLDHSETSESLTQLAYLRGLREVSSLPLANDASIPMNQQAPLIEQLLASGKLVGLPGVGIYSAERIYEAEERLLAVVAKHHELHPLLTHLDRAAILAECLAYAETALWDAIIDRLVEHKRLLLHGQRIALASHEPKLTPTQQKLKSTLVASIQAAGFSPPDLESFITPGGSHRKKLAELEEIAEVAVAEGDLIRITAEFFLHTEIEAEARRRLKQLLVQGPATMAQIRDAWGTTRKYAIPLCEFYDRSGITIREGDTRRWAAG